VGVFHPILVRDFSFIRICQVCEHISLAETLIKVAHKGQCDNDVRMRELATQGWSIFGLERNSDLGRRITIGKTVIYPPSASGPGQISVPRQRRDHEEQEDANSLSQKA
jgi:hypothetical protein